MIKKVQRKTMTRSLCRKRIDTSWKAKEDQRKKKIKCHNFAETTLKRFLKLSCAA
jgi:hypothetical protein